VRPAVLSRASLKSRAQAHCFAILRIAKQLKPDIDFLKARLSRAFKKSVLDFI
jgi:hypothetical protein